MSSLVPWTNHCVSRSLSGYQPAVYPGYQNPPGRSQPIGGAKNTTSPSIQNMGVDHRRTKMYPASMDPTVHPRRHAAFKTQTPGGVCPPGVLSQAIKNQVIWRRHRNTLPLRKGILFPKKGDCQGLFRSGGRGASRCIECSSVGAAVREWPRQAGRLAAGPGHPWDIL